MISSELDRQFKKSPKPLYIVKGDDLYYIDKVTHYFKDIVEPSTADFNLHVFNGVDKVDSVIYSLNQAAFMSQYKVVIINIDNEVKDTTAKAFMKPILEYIANPIPSNILVIFDSNENLKSFYKQIEIIDCSRQEAATLVRVVVKMIEDEGLQFDSNDIPKMIIERANCELNYIHNEILKLKSYCSDGIIKASDVEQCMMSNFELDVYAVTQAIKDNNKLEAIKSMNKLLTKSDSAISVIANISSSLKRGLYARISGKSDQELAEITKGKAYAITMARKIISNYTDKEVVELIKVIDEYDYMIKSGKISAKAAFQNTVMMLL